MRGSGLIPGFHDETHRAAFETARSRFLAAGGPRRCSARTKGDALCQGWALRGHEHCAHHAPNDVRRARRLRLLSQPKTAAQADRARRRERARIQRVIWRQDRTAPGATVALGPREDAFLADLQASVFDAASCTPATLDAARWAWLGVQAGRITVDQFRDRVRWHLAKDAAGDVGP
jgi:hypothetical protein